MLEMIIILTMIFAEVSLSHGIAEKYHGDVGIENDPAVLFCENFEKDSLEKIAEKWDSVSNDKGKVIFLSKDIPPDSSGKQSLQITATLGQNTGGHLYTRLEKPVDQLYARFYVKFAEDAEYIHHFVHMGGYNPPTPWPQGGAGERPAGNERITVGIEPHGEYGRYPAPGIWSFYSYWHEMKISADGKYWGNALRPPKPAIIPKNRWQCVEVMVKLNSEPDIPDGELALWLDGKLTVYIHKGVMIGKWSGMGFNLMDDGGETFEGFRWRNSNDLKLNFFWLLHYVTENAARQNRVDNPKKENTVWFDDIVVATEYIGLISKP